MSRRAEQTQQPKDRDGEAAGREFLEAIRSLAPQDVAHRIDADQPPPSVAGRPKRRKGPQIVATIDLHRLTGAEAVQRLRAEFVRLCGRTGLVQVIVGKGTHSEDGIGVLHESIPRWMDAGGREFVAEWRWASPREGGRGALMVRLRRAGPPVRP